MSLEFDQALGWKIACANVVLKTHFQNKIRATGLSVTTEQWAVLHSIAIHPESTQTGIAKDSLRDKTVVTRILDILQREGWVVRRTVENDRRAFRVGLTDEGARVHGILLRLAQEANDTYERILGEDGKRIHELLDRIIAAEELQR